MTHSGRDELIREIRRLQGALDEVQRRLTSVPDEPESKDGTRRDGDGSCRDDVLLQARVDEAYAQLEIAKRAPTADAWSALQKATEAVGRFEGGAASENGYSGPVVRLTLFASVSGPSLRALAAVEEVVRGLGARNVSLDVCDVSRDPERAERAGVVFTPVLRVERAGHPPLTIFGALDDRAHLLSRLERAGLPVAAAADPEPVGNHPRRD